MGRVGYLVRLSAPCVILEKTDVVCSWNHGQVCAAGSRIFVQEGIYDEFMKRFLEKTRSIKVGDPFNPDTFQGPQVSEIQFNVSHLIVNLTSYFAYLMHRNSIAHHGIYPIGQGCWCQGRDRG